MKYLLIVLLLTMQNVTAQEYQDSIRDIVIKEINFARKHPIKYSKQINIALRPVFWKRKFTSSSKLDSLAQSYAELMMKTSKYRHSRMRYNESILYMRITNNVAENIVETFIIDLNVQSLGHRKHLLSHNNADIKIGVGIIMNENNELYCCIITSK